MEWISEKWCADLHAFKEFFSNLVTETLFSSNFPKRLIYIALSKQVSEGQDIHVRENIF